MMIRQGRTMERIYVKKGINALGEKERGAWKSSALRNPQKMALCP